MTSFQTHVYRPTITPLQWHIAHNPARQSVVFVTRGWCAIGTPDGSGGANLMDVTRYVERCVVVCTSGTLYVFPSEDGEFEIVTFSNSRPELSMRTMPVLSAENGRFDEAQVRSLPLHIQTRLLHASVVKLVR